MPTLIAISLTHKKNQTVIRPFVTGHFFHLTKGGDIVGKIFLGLLPRVSSQLLSLQAATVWHMVGKFLFIKNISIDLN